LLCSAPLSELPAPPVWSDAIEQAFQTSRGPEGGPEAVSLVWTNRASTTTGGAGDSDGFGGVFGTSAPAARNVVAAALSDWSRVITDFRRSDGTQTLQLTISMSGSAGFGGAGGPAATAPSDGKPRTGSITINTGNPAGFPSPNDSNGYFLDSTPNDYSEFQGTILNPFAANPTTTVGNDLYSIVASEVTHTLGLVSPKAGQGGANFNGYLLINSGLTQATGQRDASEGGGTSGYYYTFRGPTLDHAMTSYNSGDPDDDSWGNVVHTAGGTANFNFNGLNYQGTDDDGNAAGGAERVIPSWVTANIFKDAYGYTIENPAKFGTMMAVFNSATGRLNVRGINNSDDTIYLNSTNGKLTVSVDLGTDFAGSGFRSGAGNLNAWVSEFTASAVTSISIDAGTGDDFIILDQVGSQPVTVVGNGGNDQIILKGSTGNDSITVGSSTMTGTNLNVQSYSAESLRIDTRTGTADLFLPVNGAFSSLEVIADSGDETINLHSLSAGTAVTFFMGSGSDTVTLGTGPSDFLTINSPVTVNGGDGGDTLNVGSGFVQALNANVTFAGDAGGGSILYNDTNYTSTAEYDVNGGVITYNGGVLHTLTYSNVNVIDLKAGSGQDFFTVHSNVVVPTVRAYGFGGNDSYTLGDGPALSGVRRFEGGAGTLDTMTIDTHSDTTGRAYQISPTSIDPTGWTFNYGEVERLTLLAGTGSDTFVTTAGVYNQAMTIDAGGGVDWAQFYGVLIGSLTVRGGNDSSPDSLTVDDRTLPAAMSGGFVYADHFRRSVNWTSTSDIYYSGFSAVDWYQKDNQNLVSVYGISPDIGSNTQFWIGGGTADDYAEVYPFDSQGNPTILGNLAFNGADGPDTLRVFNNSTVPANYRFFTQFGGSQLYIDGGGNHWTEATTAVENVDVHGGGGADNFAVEQLQSGASVRLFGNSGNDTCTIGNGDMSANLTNAAAFTFDGQGGSDRFTVSNGVTNVPWTYRVRNGFVETALTAGGYSWHSDTANIESQYLMAGSADDSFNVDGTAVGLYTECNGFGGGDVLSAGFAANTVNGIRGPVSFNAGAGGGRVSVSNGGGLPATVHQDATTIGAYAGDNLFGAGGSLTFSGLTNIGVAAGLAMVLASNSTVYAQPLASAQAEISGGFIFQSPSGSIKLALASVTNPVINGTSSSGSLTSTNRQSLSWFRFAGPIDTDSVAPAVINGDINLNGVPGVAESGNKQAVDVRFSENVSGLISPGSLVLTNLTTSQTIPSSNVAVSYDSGTNTAHFTFPGYPNGVLPDGNYSGKILAGLPDFFGNGLPADANFSFFFLAGDANHDHTVNLQDFNILASNFGQSNRTFSQGDFNYDGTVNLADFNILASRFGTSLATARSAALGDLPFASSAKPDAQDADRLAQLLD
jgi:hypothetical protein